MTAQESYKNLIDTLSKMAETFERYASENNIKFCKEGFLKSFDVVLQHSLLEIAVSDYAVTANEILYLRDLVKHGSWVDFFNSAKYKSEPITWTTVYKSKYEDLKELLRIADDGVKKLASNIVCIFAAYDLAMPENYAEQFKEAWLTIATTLAKKDAEFSSVEKEALVKSVMSCVYNAILNKMDDIKKRTDNGNSEESCQADCPRLKITKKLINNEKTLYYGDDNFNNTIVYIETDSGSGTGFVVSEWGHVITCAHVVNKSKNFYIKVCNDEGFKIVKADLVNMDEAHDFALLKMQSGTYEYLKLADQEFKPKMGEEIAILGFPFGGLVADKIEDLSLSLTKGYVSSIQKKNGIKNAYLDISARKGNSGSPVIDTNTGIVIGILCGSIVSGSENHVEEINYMRPITYFWELFTI